MGTTTYGCGCSITSSMFGDHCIMFITPCDEHKVILQPELQALASKIRELNSTQKITEFKGSL